MTTPHSVKVLGNKTEFITLVRWKAEDILHYAYVAIPAGKLENFNRAMEGTENFSLSDYGHIIYSDTGEPSEEIMAYMAEHFLFDHSNAKSSDELFSESDK